MKRICHLGSRVYPRITRVPPPAEAQRRPRHFVWLRQRAGQAASSDGAIDDPVRNAAAIRSPTASFAVRRGSADKCAHLAVVIAYLWTISAPTIRTAARRSALMLQACVANRGVDGRKSKVWPRRNRDRISSAAGAESEASAARKIAAPTSRSCCCGAYQLAAEVGRPHITTIKVPRITHGGPAPCSHW